MSTLFVNACLRGEDSRTLKLCKEYLKDIPDVEEINLAEMRLQPFYGEDVAYRLKLQEAGNFNDPIFDLAKQIASADEVVIGSPYWDLSFPSALKVYIEHTSVCDLTFEYTDDARCVGKCKARTLTFICSCGGYVDGANYGYEYLCGIAQMYGIPEVRFIVAEGLDVVGIDIDACMQKAYDQISKLKAEQKCPSPQ